MLSIVFDRPHLGRAVSKADERGSDEPPTEAGTEEVEVGNNAEEDRVGVVDGLPTGCGFDNVDVGRRDKGE